MSRAVQLYVKNLAWTVGNSELRNHFLKFGPISNSSVMFDKKTGVHQGYGFVRFQRQESAESALNDPMPLLDGRRLEISLAHGSRFNSS